MSFFQILEDVLAYLPFFENISPAIAQVVQDLSAIEALSAANNSANIAAFSFYIKKHQYTVGPIPVVRNS